MSFNKIFNKSSFLFLGIVALIFSCNEDLRVDKEQEALLPEIISFSPQEVKIGEEVKVVGLNFNYAEKAYVGDSAVDIQRVNDSLIIISIGNNIKGGLIKVINENEEGVESTSPLSIIYNVPVIEEVPEGGLINDAVVITGSNLEYIQQIIVGDKIANIISQRTDELVFQVPFLVANQVTLSYVYVDAQGTKTLSLEENGFNIYKVWPSFSTIPSPGMINTEITIIGENLNVVDSAYIGDYKAEITSQNALTLKLVIPNETALEGYRSIKLYSYGGQEIASDPVLRVITKLEKILETFESYSGDPFLLKKTDMGQFFTTALNLNPSITAPEENFYGGMKLDYDQSVYNNSGSTYAEFYYIGDNNLIDINDFTDPWVHIWINTNNTSPYFVFYCDLSVASGTITKGTHYVKRFNSADYGEGWQLFAWRMSDLQFRASSTSDPYTSEEFSIYNLKTFRIQMRTTSDVAIEVSEFNIDFFMIVDGKLSDAHDVTSVGN